MQTYDFKNKKTNINQLNNYMLAKTLSMFEYEGLPDSIPVRELERLLQIGGYAFITKAPSGKLYAFHGGLGGVPCPYGNPTEIIIANPALNFYKTLKLKTDGVLIRSDDLAMGLMPMYEKYHGMLVENDINIVLDGYSTRMNTVISASDDKTKESAEAYMSKVVDGEISIIGENALFDGVRVQTGSGGAGTASSRLIELTQYLKGSLYNEVGLSSNFVMKKERLITAEVEQQEDGTFPFVYNMMKCRLKGMERVNKMFGTNINVDFGSVWNIKNRKFVDDVIDRDDDNRDYDDYEDYQEDENFIDTDNDGEVEDTEIIEQVVEDEVSEDEVSEVVEDEVSEIIEQVVEDEVSEVLNNDEDGVNDEPIIEDTIDDIDTEMTYDIIEDEPVIESVIEDEVSEEIVEDVIVDEVSEEIVEDVIDEPIVEDEVSEEITIEDIQEIVEDAVEEMTDEIIEEIQEIESVVDDLKTTEDEDMNLLFKEDGTIEELTVESFSDLITSEPSDDEDNYIEVTTEYVDFTDDFDYSELEAEMLIVNDEPIGEEIDEVIEDAIDFTDDFDYSALEAEKLIVTDEVIEDAIVINEVLETDDSVDINSINDDDNEDEESNET